MWRPRSSIRGPQILVKTITGKTPHLQLDGSFPEKSPPRTRSLRLAWGVFASHEESLPRRELSAPSSRTLLVWEDSASDYSFTREVSALTTTGPARGGRNGGATARTNVALPRCSDSPATTRRAPVSPRHASASAGSTCGSPALTRADASSHPTLWHTNSVRSTRVPTIINTYLLLGPNVVGSTHAQAGWVITEELKGSAKYSAWTAPPWHAAAPNSTTTQLPFTASWQASTNERTSQVQQTP
jgi:hypothetical protein